VGYVCTTPVYLRVNIRMNFISSAYKLKDLALIACTNPATIKKKWTVFVFDSSTLNKCFETAKYLENF